MELQTNTSGVDFLFNNLQAALQSGSNTNGLVTNGVLPVLLAMESQVATQLSGRNPGGIAYHGETNVVAPNSTSAMVLLDNLETGAAKLPYVKNGAFSVSLSGTNAVTVPLTNTQTNSSAQVGDTIFAKYNKIILWNLSGVDGNNSASMTVGPAATNGNKLQLPLTNSTITIDGSSAHVFASVNGVTINAANAAITITPTANSTFGCVIMGS
jgi:hypothetical protein